MPCARSSQVAWLHALLVLCSFCRGNAFYPESNKHAEWTARIRRLLHQHPELGMEEHKTGEIIRQVLDEMGIAYRYPVAKTGIVATLGRGGGKTVALRADMDALPVLEPPGLAFRSTVDGLMHACGHDAHMAMLLAAARLLKEREATLPGTVRLVFQPGEEGFAGARDMIAEGVMDGVDAVFGFHNMPFLDTGIIGGRAGTIMAGCAQFHIVVRGRGGHAAMPHGNVDPIVAAAHLVTSMQTIASRETSPLDSIVVSTTIVKAGEAYNVIPDVAELGGTVRALRMDTFERTMSRIDAMAASVAAAFQCSVSVDWEVQPPYPPTVNAPEAWKFAAGVAAALFGEQQVQEVEPIMPGEDFAFFLQKVPGAMIFLGHRNGTAGSGAALHSPNFVLDEEVLARGAALHAQLALSFLESGGFHHSPGTLRRQEEL